MLNKLKNIEIESFCKYDYESIVKCFWMHSVSMRLNEFDFEGAFESLRQPIENKLVEHGLMDYEAFADNEEQIYDFSVLEQFAVSTDYFNFSFEDAKEAILKAKYEKYEETFSGYSEFEDLKDLLEEIDNSDSMNDQQKNELFDKIIHAQHVTGAIFDDLDIESLHEEVDNEINELLGIAV